MSLRKGEVRDLISESLSRGSDLRNRARLARCATGWAHDRTTTEGHTRCNDKLIWIWIAKRRYLPG
jgi:hypothetical protein